MGLSCITIAPLPHVSGKLRHMGQQWTFIAVITVFKVVFIELSLEWSIVIIIVA